MLRRLVIVCIGLLVSVTIFAQQGTLQGKVIDATNGEAIAFANVSIELNGQVITGGMTDFDGKFVIKPIPAGTYDVKASYVGYHPLQYKGVKVMAGKITFQDFRISPAVQQLQEVEVKEYKVPLISKDQTQSGGSVTDKEIAKMPGRSAEAVATTVGGVYSERGEVGSIRGARAEATVYIIDGVKVRGTSALPKSATAQVDVIMGGIPAKYGDVTGGIISVTTKEPSRETHGSLELSTSKFLDPYGYYLAEGMITGPLFTKKIKDPYDSTKIKKEVKAGYFLTASFNYEKDNAPSVIGIWQAKDGVVDDLLATPYRTNESGFGTILNADYLGKDKFENVKARSNVGSKQMMVQGKIDYKLSKNVNLTIGATYDHQQSRLFSYANTMFNSNNNGEAIDNTMRGFVRLTQKFQSNDEKENATALIKNAYYQIQVDYSKFNEIVQDPNQKDNLFNYGYVGKFNTTKINSYSHQDSAYGATNVMVHDGFRDIDYAFTPSDLNPDLSAYSNYYYSLYDPNSFMYSNSVLVEAGGGLLNGQSPDAVYGLYNSPGTPYNQYYKLNQNQFRLSASGSADVKDHEISLGFEFEQRDDSYFGVNPMSLWTLGRAYTNAHILELDKSNPHYVYDAMGVFQDTIWFDRLYSQATQYQFDEKLREALGMPANGTNWIDFDSYDPSIYKIDFFSADELLNNGNNLVTYYGYDAYGKKISGNPTLNDFFTKKDEKGRYLREIPSYQPIYGAAYIQDKFAFNDLIFNIGVRIDRFDANQMVLKDQFSLYETKKLSEVPGSLNPIGVHPGNIPSDAVVYADDVANPTKIYGYRVGTNLENVKWYDANGTQVTDPSTITSANGMAPILTDPNSGMSVKAFKDYEPQINVMPRVAFSFPISDVALFFAHYDILTKRPSGYSRMNPISYLYIINQSTDAINNPDLKTEKTIDYELGFQQKLSNTSSLKLSAFYREMRDMIQVQYVTGAYPVRYMTYTNIDFGTVKGLSVAYDLRRTGNVTLRINYTLQFANGTGSNAETSKALIQTGQPNLRTTIPLDFDQRHAISGNIDYRFASGPAYNGPKWFGTDFFQNTGANFTLNYGTGSPYSKKDINTNYLVGSLNGARKPARFTVNARIDKDIDIKYGSEKNKTAGLNIYLEINNLLNNKGILNVYSTTGNADDDGYLTAAKNQVSINAQHDPDAYKNYYTMYINYPYHYSFARTIRLGVMFSF